NYHARMLIEIRQKDQKDGRTLQFKIVSGALSGLTGQLQAKDAGFLKTHVSLVSAYDYQKWLLPKLFLEFGLEIVLEKFSQRLRTLIEEDFKSGKWTPDKSVK